jgi:hypothetical protein
MTNRCKIFVTSGEGARSEDAGIKGTIIFEFDYNMSDLNLHIPTA